MKDRDGHPHPDWALAYVLVKWRREVGPLVRKSYNLACNEEHDPELTRRAAERLEGMARSLRAVIPPG